MNKKIISCIVFLLILFIFVASDANSEECFSYEPTKVTLTGTIIVKTFPGPPEFESIEKGDRPETYWILKIKRPVCVNGDPKDEVNLETEKNVQDMQLVLSIGKYARYKHLVTKQVVVDGTLFHAITGHHHTKVLLEVTSIKPAKDENKK
ncbi:MAG: DUF4431 domain-containing protein [Deltaproteobacteria bacterium]|nr:DUF4431 domain-containing protein [Deltaproteobacteria bacterium]